MIHVVVSCDRDGCEASVSAPWPADAWASVRPTDATLDGHAPIDLDGWEAPGPLRWPYSSEAIFGVYCPEHASPS